MAIDVEAIKTIQSFEGNSLPDNPWNYTQICRAAQLGIGVKGEAECNVVKNVQSS